MTEIGPLLASGRDSDIFEFGAGKVLRRARDGRSLESEAAVMDYARSHGYPVPAVHELLSGGTEMVLDRVMGPHLLEVVARQPWRLARMGGVLAALHTQLHEIPAPPGLRQSPDGGDRLLHLDLHPLNVLISPNGPMVIDWPNAARGHPATDVADTWLVLSAAELPDRSMRSRLIGRARSLFIRAFLHHFDRDEVQAYLAGALERRAADRNHSEAERVAMRAVAARYAPR